MKIKELKINNAEQGTHDWRVARLGKVTSTRVADLMSKGRGKDEIFGKTAVSMMAEIQGERLLLKSVVDDEELFQQWSDLQCRENAAMRYGKENEPIARQMYEMVTGSKVTECGLVDHPTVESLAGSPDGLVVGKGNEVEGCIEIKCPSTTKTVVTYQWGVKDGKTLKEVMPQYYWQCQNNMNVTGAKWCDFVVFSTFLKRDTYIARIERNDDDIKLINERVQLMNEYIKEQEDGIE